MAITLRTNKGSALTYREMDVNFSSFFYSASINIETAELKLHYTGSTNLDISGESYDPSRTVIIPLNPTEGQAPNLTVADPVRSVQFNANGSQLGGSSEFIYTTQGFLGVGIGTPLQRLHVRGNTTYPAILRLESTNTDGISRKSSVEFYQGNTSYGTVGRENPTDNHLYIKTFQSTTQAGHLVFNIGSNTNAGAWTSTGLGIGTLTPQQALQVQGNGYFTNRIGVGTTVDTSALNVFQNTQLQASSGEFVHISKFGITPIANTVTLNMTAVRTVGGSDWTTSGMRLQQQVDDTYMGYIQFSGDGNNNGFSIGTGEANVGFGDVYNTVPERFRITSIGNIGINTPTPTEKLTVGGNISGSGTLQISTLANGSAATTSAVVATSAGLFQKIDAAPIPKGGIIMWSGAISAIPTGWYLCNGSNNTPDLRDKFVVGAGNTYAVDAIGGSANAVVVSHNHGGVTTSNGNHNHYIAVGGTQTSNNTNSLFDGTGTNRQELGLSTRAFDQSSDAFDYELVTVTGTQNAGATNTTGAHTHTINTDGESGTNKNLPPYYALAYIMYGGI